MGKKDEKDGRHNGQYEVHLQRFDEIKPAKVKASPEFRTTYSIAGEAERRAQERSSEKMDDTNKEPLEVSKPGNSWHDKGEAPMDGAEAVETENSRHEKGEAPVDAGEAVEMDPPSDK